MADGLRSRVLAAVLDVRLDLGPNAIYLASKGESIRLSGGEADALTDAVMAVLDQAPALTAWCDPGPETPEFADRPLLTGEDLEKFGGGEAP